MADADDDLDLNTLDDDELVEQVHDDLYNGLRNEVVEATNIFLKRGWGPDKVLNDALVEGMRIVGVDFRDGILFVPEVLLAANAMKGGMEILRPLLAETGAEPIGKMVIGTVKGDIHDIGKNLVSMMMEGAGFEVIDIGINNPVEKYFDALAQHKPDILGMSALLTTTMPYMKVVIDTMKEKGIRDDFIVLVGGAPLNEEFGKAVGADAYCREPRREQGSRHHKPRNAAHAAHRLRCPGPRDRCFEDDASVAAPRRAVPAGRVAQPAGEDSDGGARADRSAS
jgi:methylmalonyl-CoA mutase cobalamin-binding domain/chain